MVVDSSRETGVPTFSITLLTLGVVKGSVIESVSEIKGNVALPVRLVLVLLAAGTRTTPVSTTLMDGGEMKGSVIESVLELVVLVEHTSTLVLQVALDHITRFCGCV